jgi:hypothetical protein
MSRDTLRAEIIPVQELSTGLSDRLYGLYDHCYDGADRERFYADLGEKHWIILLRDSINNHPAGFSTQMLIRVTVHGRPICALFSGDTIIHPAYWGSQELVRAWCRFAGQLKANLGNSPLFWFLISKGYRTYLYLPCFFRTFHPRYDSPTPPFEAQLIGALGMRKYPKEFDPCTGVVAHGGVHDRLKSALDSTEKHVRNPHVDYFIRRNPHYWKGDELVCVAEITPDNMRSIAKRELEIGLQSVEPLRAVLL